MIRFRSTPFKRTRTASAASLSWGNRTIGRRDDAEVVNGDKCKKPR